MVPQAFLESPAAKLLESGDLVLVRQGRNFHKLHQGALHRPGIEEAQEGFHGLAGEVADDHPSLLALHEALRVDHAVEDRGPSGQ